MMALLQKLKTFSFIKVAMLLLMSTMFLCSCKIEMMKCTEVPEVQNGELTCEEYVAREQKDCWQASILGMLYTYMGDITMETYKNLTDGAMNVMMVLFAVWLSFQVIKHLGTLKEPDPAGKFWTGVIKQFFLCFACGYLASSTEGLLYFLNNMLFPVFNAFLELASYLLANIAETEDSKAVDAMGTLTVFKEEYKTTQVICSASREALMAEMSDSAFPEAPNYMMQCLVCNISDKLNLGVFMSRVLMTSGLVVGFIIGFIILAIFLFVKLGFVFYLVDTIFKFTMMVILLPIFLLGYPFKQTRSWMTKGLKVILAGAAYVLAIAVTACLCLLAIVQIINNSPETFGAPIISFVGLSPELMVLLLIGMLVKKAMEVAGKLANTFTGSSITSKFQEALAGVVRLGLQLIGSVISAGALTPIFTKVEWMRKIYERTKEIKEKVDEVKKKIDKLSGGRGADDDDEDEDEDDKDKEKENE